MTAEVLNRARTIDRDERMENMRRIHTNLRSFLSSMDRYEVIPEFERLLYEKQTSSVPDPAKRRELKIKQYKGEKELRTKIESVRKRRRLQVSQEPSLEFDLIASLLPSVSSSDSAEDDDESETEDLVREATLLLLRLTFTQAHSQLDSLQQELDLLRSMPPPPPPSQDSSNDPRAMTASGQDDIWRLDAPIPTGGPDGKGPLIDLSGKPLRPFTILPAGSTDRARLQAQVFQPDHRLPTMSIDQYLDIERQRGKFISGGGPQSENQPTSSEQLAIDSEMDGTTFGEEKAEEKRQKDETWARYTDSHRKGEGNTMNRG